MCDDNEDGVNLCSFSEYVNVTNGYVTKCQGYDASNRNKAVHKVERHPDIVVNKCTNLYDNFKVIVE